MGKSFVLRNRTGKAVGYIQQVGDMLRCGIHEPGEQKTCDLYLVDDCGSVHKKEIDAVIHEHKWRMEFVTITGGCLAMDGTILAETGKDISRRMQAHWVRKAAKERSLKHEEGAEKQSKRQENTAYPKKHWPPNPCCPENSF